MRTLKPVSIYPDKELRSAVEQIAARQGRSSNQQILRFIRAGIERYERRQMRRSTSSVASTSSRSF